MTKLSKNLFFSTDEIEAVDMEIETLLLARKHLEASQNSYNSGVTCNESRPSYPMDSSMKFQGARTADVPSTYTLSSPGVLPPQRQEATDRPKPGLPFRIEHQHDPLVWPDPDLRPDRQRYAKQIVASGLKRKSLAYGSGMVAIVFVMMVATSIWTN